MSTNTSARRVRAESSHGVVPGLPVPNSVRALPLGLGRDAEPTRTDAPVGWIPALPDKALAELREWQACSLDAIYPIVFIRALPIKVAEGRLQNKTVYFPIAVRRDGGREVLGFWFESTPSQKFRRRMLEDLRGRGVADILMVVVDDVPGLAGVVHAVFPQTLVIQDPLVLCDSSLGIVEYADTSAVAHALRNVLQAASTEEAAGLLDAFAAAEYGQKYPQIAQFWRREWAVVATLLALPVGVRQVICATHARERLLARLTRLSRNRGVFATDEVAAKSLYLTARAMAGSWLRPPRAWGWKHILVELAGHFPTRFPTSSA